MYNLETENFIHITLTLRGLMFCIKRCIDNLLWTYHAKFKLYF